MNTDPTNQTHERTSGGISLRNFLLIIGALFLIFGIATAVTLMSEPEPRPLAPGQSFHPTDPLEII